MPFDGRGFDQVDFVKLQKLEDVRLFLRSADHWCQGSFRTPDGHRYCIFGAMRAADAVAHLEPIIAQAVCDVAKGWLRLILRLTSDKGNRIGIFNDDPKTNFHDIEAVLDRAHAILMQ